MSIAQPDLVQLRADVLEVTKVIGRQEAPTLEANESAARLLDRFSSHPSGPVPAISLLYQNHDATAALVAAAIFASHLQEPRRSAVAATRRIATTSTVVEGIDMAAGTPVLLDLESTGLEFGAGPHHCPGRHIAEQIVAGMIAAIEFCGYRIDDTGIELHADGRPKVLPLKRRALSNE